VLPIKLAADLMHTPTRYRECHVFSRSLSRCRCLCQARTMPCGARDVHPSKCWQCPTQGPTMRAQQSFVGVVVGPISPEPVSMTDLLGRCRLVDSIVQPGPSRLYSDRKTLSDLKDAAAMLLYYHLQRAIRRYEHPRVTVQSSNVCRQACERQFGFRVPTGQRWSRGALKRTRPVLESSGLLH
jgi:hypothetical protein